MTKQHRAIVQTSIAITTGAVLVLSANWMLSSSFSFTNVKEGQQLSGNAVVLVSCRGTIHFVELSIDGQRVSAQNTDTYGDDQSARFDVPTYLFPNGLHTLEITAGAKVYDRRHVAFQNAKHPQ